MSYNDLMSPAGANPNTRWMMAVKRHVYQVILKGLEANQLHIGALHVNPSSCSANWHLKTVCKW